MVSDRASISIPAEHHAHVFTPFFRIEGSRHRNTGGVGLGLPAAKATVLERGGTLSRRNRRGGGLEVTVVLPIQLESSPGR
jgi:signal transduction histidine kinase